MSPWTAPRARAYRDSSPTSPLTPLSPSSLPLWLRPVAPKAGLLGHSRLKTYGLVFGVLILGWWATSALGPGGDVAAGDYEPDYGKGSEGLLNEPHGFGQADVNSTDDGIIGEHDQLVTTSGTVSKAPTLKGALSELHNAVSDKLPYWVPFKGSPSGTSESGSGHNRTSTDVETGKPGSKRPKYHGEDIKDGWKDEDKLGARTRIGKCTMVFNGNSYWERALRTHEQHDKLHGYRLHVLRQTLLDDVWSKPAYMLSIILRELAKPESERLEWLLWVDADTIILNPHIPVETFLPPLDFDDIHLVYSNDWNGLNNGIFPVKVNQWSADLFSAILAYRYYRPTADITFRDQSAMDALIHEPKFARHITSVPQRWFNAYQGEHNETLAPFQIRRGDLLVHFAGVPGREERMGYWLERTEQHLDDWEIPVKSTSYPQEAKDFWNEQRVLRKAKQEQVSELRLSATTLLSTTEESLNNYGNRLTNDQRKSVEDAREALKKLVEQSDWEDHLDYLATLTQSLRTISEPLTSTVAGMQKTLLATAHEAIFASEKDLLDSHWTENSQDSDLRRLSDAVNGLKDVVMSPQDSWQMSKLENAVEAVTQARTYLQEKKAKKQAAIDAQRLDAQRKAQMTEDARKQMLAEADQLKSSAVRPTLSEPQAEESSTPSHVYGAAGTYGAAGLYGAAGVAPVVAVTAVAEHQVTITPEPAIVYETIAA